MTLQAFIEVFADLFEDTEKSVFTPNTRYKELEEWSSLMALSVIAMVDEECNVSISSDAIKNSQTIEELYNNIFA